MAAGLFYWLTPRLYGVRLHSVPMANFHFWTALFGILMYVAAMWVSGIMQGLMLNATNAEGTALVYPNFIETLNAIRPMMGFRIIGGSMYLVGMGLMAWNLWQTAKSGKAVNEKREITVIQSTARDGMPLREGFFGDPVVHVFMFLLLILGWLFLPADANIVSLIGALVFAAMVVSRAAKNPARWSGWYDRLLESWLPFTILTFVAVALGGLIQIIPTVMVNRAKNMEDRIQQVYTPLELAGRDIYVSEGCYNCHSQMIRTLLPDVLRYGDYSRMGESIYDHPFQWGSKRTGPDLAREGDKYPHSWHYNHMRDPRSTSAGSNMPAYPHLFTEKFDQKGLPAKIAAMVRLGVPYPAMTDVEIKEAAIKQGIEIVNKLKEDKLAASPDTQIVAIIAYLQKLGKYDTPEIEGRILTSPQGIRPPLAPINPDRERDAALKVTGPAAE